MRSAPLDGSWRGSWRRSWRCATGARSCRSRREQAAQPHQIVRRTGEREDPTDFVAPSVMQLPEQPDALLPTNSFLHQLPFPLTALVGHMPCRAAIDGAPSAAIADGVGTHVRREAQGADGGDEAGRIVALV